MAQIFSRLVTSRKLKILVLVIQIFIFGMLFLNFFLQYLQYKSRISLGFGITDEAYAISNLIDRAKNGQSGNTMPFADVLFKLYLLADSNIETFRIFGLVVIYVITLTYFCCSFLQSQKILKQSDALLLSSIFCVLIPLISTGFRFLLLTPTYQWIVLSLSFFVPLIAIQVRKSLSPKLSHFLILSSAFLTFLCGLGRPTSGLVLFLVLFSFFKADRNTNRNLALWYSSYLSGFCLFYFIRFPRAVLEQFERYRFLAIIDPIGSNPLREFWDVSRAILIFALLVFISLQLVRISRRFLRQNRIELRSLLFFALILVIWCCLLLTSTYKDFPHMVSFLIVGCISFLSGNLYSRPIPIRYWLLIIAPILTQFGSNIDATYLFAPFILCALVYLFSSLILSLNVMNDPDSSISRLNLSSLVLIIFTLAVILRLLISSFTYENDLKYTPRSQDSVFYLEYSNDRISAIQDFRNQIKGEESQISERILDLSFWHPGVILFASRLPYPYGTFDKTFESTIDKQVISAIFQENVNVDTSKSSIIIRTNRSSPIGVCLPLQNYVSDRSIREVLETAHYNPMVKEIGIYRSVESDLTLFPMNVSLLVRCLR